MVMTLLVAATLLGMLWQQKTVKGELADARTLSDELQPQADNVVAVAASANQIYADSAILFRNVELSWYINKHNTKYPVLYKSIAVRLPSYVRVLSLAVDPGSIVATAGAKPAWPGMKSNPQPQPGGQPAPGGTPPGTLSDTGQQQADPSEVTVNMKCVLGNYSQYSDTMIALTRKLNNKDFVTAVSRSGFFQNMGQEGGGATDTGARPAPANWTTIDVVMRVKANLVVPNPVAALAEAAGGAVAGGGDLTAPGGG